MARIKMTRNKIDSIYWYKQGSKKRFAYRYKYHDQHDVRREKSKQGFESIEKAERSLIEVKTDILDENTSFVENDSLTVQQLNKIYVEASDTNWKPTTRRNHLYIMDNYVLGAIG